MCITRIPESPHFCNQLWYSDSHSRWTAFIVPISGWGAPCKLPLSCTFDALLQLFDKAVETIVYNNGKIQERKVMDRLGCPIEMEPKTLNQGNLSIAREAAVEIIQNKEAKEASGIFTQGMTAVKTREEMKEEIEKRDQLLSVNELVQLEEAEGDDVCNESWDDILPSTLDREELFSESK